MSNWSKLLKTLGFTESESKVYLTSLELGGAPVQEIAKRANVSRVTTYAAIDALAKYGLMSTVQKGKRKLYIAEAPERLTSYVGTRIKEMEATLREVEDTLGELKLLQRGEKPVVKLFEGKEALKAIQDDVLSSKPDEIDEFGNFDEIARVYAAADMAPFYRELARHKTKRRLIFLAKERTPKSDSPEVQIETLPAQQFDFKGDLFVYGNKVALSTFRGRQISVLVESADLADTVRAFFEFAWRCLRRT